MKKPLVIGIAGGSGSGKSTFAHHLKEAFPDECGLISCDNYYLPHDDLTMEQRQALNYDAPAAIEFSLMCQQVQDLKEGKTVEIPVYDFSIHNRVDEVIVMEPKPILIIDGILLFADPDLRDLLDLKIFVETDADERILRRARRDVIERGRTIENVMEQYLSTVKPMHNLYVEPSKIYADLIVNGGRNPQALDVVQCWMSRHLELGQ